MKPSVLMAWIGDADIDAANKNNPNRLGPIGQALKEKSFSHAYLLALRKAGETYEYKTWLTNQTFTKETTIEIYPQKLKSPTDFEDIYRSARQTIQNIDKNFHDKGILNYSMTFHLSPGTPIMATVWIFLAKTDYPASLIVSSVPSHGVQTVDVPYKITVSPDFVQQFEKPEIVSAPPAFSDIICKCDVMRELINEANIVALYDVKFVLILGESGTGKELFARAIHKASPRNKYPFIAVNCGAFSRELLQSELFGHEKGAFTGAAQMKKGVFERAQGGTIFLDEIGEMEKDLQVNLLRVIQEKEVRRVGGNIDIPIDVQLITATNKNLQQEVNCDRFREDLYYRIVKGKIMKLPPLNERGDDLPYLINFFLKMKNEEYDGKPGWKPKKLSSSALHILCAHDWPGNVRELDGTIERAALSAQDEIISEKDVQKAMLFISRKGNDPGDILNRKLGNGFNLENLLDEVASHYMTRALNQVTGKGKKKKAAEMLGFTYHQTFSNWLKRLHL